MITKKIRSIHIYVGLISAPIIFVTIIIGVIMLLFPEYTGEKMATIRSFHKQMSLKDGLSLKSLVGKTILIFASIGLIFNIISGVIMAKANMSKRTFLVTIGIGVLFLTIAILTPILLKL